MRTWLNMAASKTILTCMLLHIFAVAGVVSVSYVTYKPGSLPIILSSPHGGYLNPFSIRDREDGCYNTETNTCTWAHSCAVTSSSQCNAIISRDSGTKELTLAISDELFKLTGRRPHVIINELYRGKLDANRASGEAAQGEPEALEAWNKFHSSITVAKNTVKTGLLLDIHGQKHKEKWIELGYLMTKSELNGGKLVEKDSSIRSVSMVSSLTFEEILRGPKSFGAFLDSLGTGSEFKKIVPSPNIRGPGAGGYYSGGYITRTHGSRDRGNIDAIQIESPAHLRTNVANRAKYAKQIALTIRAFLNAHYGTKL